MKSEFALAFNEVLEDKGLPRETILEALAQDDYDTVASTYCCCYK